MSIVNNNGEFPKMSCFGSDGTDVMLGEINAVRTKVTDKISKTIKIHCHNHRLSIAAKHGCEETSSLRKFDNTDTALINIITKHQLYVVVYLKSKIF